MNRKSGIKSPKMKRLTTNKRRYVSFPSGSK
jgi:hypothetical protein